MYTQQNAPIQRLHFNVLPRGKLTKRWDIKLFLLVSCPFAGEYSELRLSSGETESSDLQNTKLCRAQNQSCLIEFNLTRTVTVETDLFCSELGSVWKYYQ
jgi:hypothetical protein